MGIFERIYDRVPVYIQNLMCSVKGWQIQRRRYNKQFFEELAKYESRAYAPAEQLTAFVKKAVLLPAYRNVLSEEEIEDLSAKNIYKYIQRFPILEKNKVKNNLQAYVNTACNEPLFQMRTSGTTGGGLVFPYTVRMENRHWAVWWRYRRELGIGFDTWCGWFGGKRIISPNNHKTPFWRVNRPGRQLMFSSQHLNKYTVAEYMEEIKRRDLKWLHGYPSHLAKFAALIADTGFEPLRSVEIITTGAENLVSYQVKMIKKAFPNAIVRQHYGLMEGVANISQNIDGKWLIDSDFSFVEFIPLNEKDRTQCRIIGTGFSNDAFMLVRYDTGDLATVEWLADGTPKILSIDGRSSNILKGPDNFEINEARLSIVLHDFNNIIEAQFHQKTLTNIDLLIVKNKNYCKEDEQLLKENLSSNFDKRIQVNIKYVDALPRTKAGKLKLVVSDLNPNC